MFWTLEYVGYQDVHILDGGWNTWVDADMKTTSEPDFQNTTYPIELNNNRIIRAEEIQHRLTDP